MVLLHRVQYLATQTGINAPTLAASVSALKAVTVSKVEKALFQMMAYLQ